MKRIQNIEKAIYSNNNFNTIKFKGQEFNVRKYTDNSEKIAIAEVVSSAAISTDDINLVTAGIMFKLEVMRVYANISYTDGDFVTIYNVATQSGLYNEIINNISHGDFSELETIVNNRLREIELNYIRENNITGYIEKGLQELVKLGDVLKSMYVDGSMEDMISSLSEELNNLDPEKLKYVNEFMKKVE